MTKQRSKQFIMRYQFTLCTAGASTKNQSLFSNSKTVILQIQDWQLETWPGYQFLRFRISYYTEQSDQTRNSNYRTW